MRWTIAALACLSLTASAQQSARTPDLCIPPPSAAAPSLPAKLMDGMGVVSFPITTRSAEARKFFEQGVAQMHSFWAREAERSFLQAAALDPEAPMPWWGVAMVAAGDWVPRFQLLRNNVWVGKSLSPSAKRAADAAAKAVELSGVPGKATELEKLYIAAVAARRTPKVKEPEEAFIKATRRLLAKYPNEIEAKTYLALMVMRGFTLDHKPKGPGSLEAVALLRELQSAAPGHPGVHHYVIHGWEGASFAADAWPSCRRYAELVPNIPHALHMPGHIYSQTGKWKDAVSAFSDCRRSETGYMKADSLYGAGHHGHNVHFLATAHSFGGDYDKALEAARSLLAFKDNPRDAKAPDTPRTPYAQGWFALLRTLVQFEKWDAVLDDAQLSEYAKPRQQAWRHWARGLAYAAKGDAANAAAAARSMDAALRDFTARTKRPAPRELKVARMELAAHLEVAAGRLDKGLKRFEAASREERKIYYDEPPWYPRPVMEAAGRIAMKAGRTGFAERAFRRALEQYPGDHHAESGLRALGLPAASKPTEAGL